MSIKILDKPRVGAGTPRKRSRYAYLYLLEDILYFPTTDDSEVSLLGDILTDVGAEIYKVYVTNPSQEYSFDATGEKDNRAFKLKFVGSHPGTELEFLEFVKKNIDRDFIVVLPENFEETKSKVLGTPEAPLTFKSSHKSGKDGSKFELNFEQEVASEDVYLHYEGKIGVEGAVGEWDSAMGNLPGPGVYLIKQGSDVMTTDGSVEDFSEAGTRITLIGQDNPMQDHTTIINGSKILLRNKTQWKSFRGSKLVLESFVTSDGQIKLIEIFRNK